MRNNNPLVISMNKMDGQTPEESGTGECRRSHLEAPPPRGHVARMGPATRPGKASIGTAAPR